MRVDVAPIRRRPLELLAQLAHEDVDRTVAARHRVAPDALVDLFAFQHAALGSGQELDELELAAREVDRAVARERLEAIRADLDLAGHDRACRLARLGPAAAAHNGLHARDQLFGVARLGQPVVGSEPQAADTLGDRRLTGADHDPESRQRRAQLLEVFPRLGPEDGEVDDDRVEPHGHDGVDRDRASEDAVLPREALQPLAEDLQEPRIGVDDGHPERRGAGGGRAVKVVRGGGDPFRHCARSLFTVRAITHRAGRGSQILHSPKKPRFPQLAANGDAEGCGEQHEEQPAARHPPPAVGPGQQADRARDRQGAGDAGGQDPGLAEHELAQRPHAATSVREPTSQRTNAALTSPQAPRMNSSEASPSGQCTPMPSAAKNVPKLVRTSPTSSFSSVSGTRRSGRWSTRPRATTATTATAAPRTAGAGPAGRAASTETISTISSPSSSTPLKAITNPAASNRSGAGGGSASSSWRSASNSANESERERRPARRSTPLRSHSMPNSSSAAPTITRRASPAPPAASAGPTTAATAPHATAAATAPRTASRGRRVSATASTIARASSSSSPQANAAARTVSAYATPGSCPTAADARLGGVPGDGGPAGDAGLSAPADRARLRAVGHRRRAARVAVLPQQEQPGSWPRSP